MPKLPKLSRFELECFRGIADLGKASVRELHDSLSDPPSYSTVRKIVERLEEKGAIGRVRKDGRAWVYRPLVRRSALVRNEVRRMLDSLFGGSAAPLMEHLAELDVLTLDDLKEVEKTLGRRAKR